MNSTNLNETLEATINLPEYKDIFIGFEWPWYMPSNEEYEKLIAKTGFNSVHIEQENKDRYFSNEDEMIKWIDQPSIVPFIQCISDNKKKNFRDTVIKRMIEKTKEDDGRCFETFRRIDVKAVK